MDEQQRARELLAQAYENEGGWVADAAVEVRAGHLDRHDKAAIAAITAALRAAPEGFVMVPVEPTEEWVRAVIRNWQPNLKEGCKGWRELEDELLHWHTAMLAARPQGVK